jgi:hypothetical protein
MKEWIIYLDPAYLSDVSMIRGVFVSCVDKVGFLETKRKGQRKQVVVISIVIVIEIQRSTDTHSSSQKSLTLKVDEREVLSIGTSKMEGGKFKVRLKQVAAMVNGG